MSKKPNISVEIFLCRVNDFVKATQDRQAAGETGFIEPEFFAREFEGWMNELGAWHLYENYMADGGQSALIDIQPEQVH